MAASSVTGAGVGESGKLTTKELAILANGPSILIAGVIECEGVGDPPTSPPASGSVVNFPQPLEGGADNYVVMLTAQNSTNTYVSQMLEEDGNFVGFAIMTANDCDVMYIVTKKGIRAKF